MEEYEYALSIIKEYIEESLFKPQLSWPEYEFNVRCYSRWAAEEILERLIRESEKLPEYLTGKVAKKPSDIIREFINELHEYSQTADDTDSSIIFYSAERTAIDIALLYKKEGRR